jgi:hypothetical protein
VTTKSNGLSIGLLMLALICAFSFGAIVKVATADSYHVTCVAHGFLEGGSQSDGSYFARVDPGCGTTVRGCDIYSYNVYRGGVTVYGTGTTCNAWSRAYGDFTECAGSAYAYDPGAFSSHMHYAPNKCF